MEIDELISPKGSQSSDKLQVQNRNLSKSMATLPDPDTNSIPKQSKSLMNKYAHLMKDTKSSAMRNAHVGKANYQTIDETLQPSPIRKKPKGLKSSPSRAGLKGGKSPSRLNKSQSIKAGVGGLINLKSTPTKEYNTQAEDNFLLHSNLDIGFEDDEQVNVKSQEDDATITLEGISGMVVMNSDKPFDSSSIVDIGNNDASYVNQFDVQAV